MDSSGSQRVYRRCGYDLAGLTDRGRCPECGGAFVRGPTRLPPVPRQMRAVSLRRWVGLAATLRLLAIAGFVVLIGTLVASFGGEAMARLRAKLHAMEMAAESGSL